MEEVKVSGMDVAVGKFIKNQKEKEVEVGYHNKGVSRELEKTLRLLEETKEGDSLKGNIMVTLLIDLEGEEIEVNNETKIIHKLMCNRIRKEHKDEHNADKEYDYIYQLKDKVTNTLGEMKLSNKQLALLSDVEEVQCNVIQGIKESEGI